ncbi:MAG: AEC family transporter [Rhodobacteraceae bacterium]|nr:AEC family transporter [Paracoccaceae bacterium]
MGNILVVVLPVFLIAGAGYLATRLKVFPIASVDGLMAYALRFAVPCLLFRAIATVDLGEVFDPGLLISFYTGAVVAFALGILGARTIFHRRPGEAVAVGFGALFSNSALLGLPIMERAYGTDSLAPNFAIISIHAPFCYLLGITVMEFARADGRGFAQTGVAVMQAMFRNALMIGLAIGFVVNLGHIQLHETIWTAVDMLANSALPAALFGLGGILTRYQLKSSVGESAMIAGLSIIVHPAISWALGSMVFDLSEPFMRSLVVTAAMAPGVNSYVFAMQYARGQAQAAGAVLLGTAVSVVTASAWIYVLGGI